MDVIKIDRKEIGTNCPTYIISEIGFNHEGDVGLAMHMIEEAAKTGVDAVKFQTFKASDLVFESSEHFDLIKCGELSLCDHIKLVEVANDNNVEFLSTPFSMESVDVLEKIRVPAYKVASMDLTNLPLLKYIAAIGKPMFVSTGMATLREIAEAVETIKNVGNDNIVLLHCISKYPAVPEEACLRTIPLIKDSFGLPVGYSDHVQGNTTSIAAVVLGACVLEKHFTTDKDLPGPDHKISSDPCEMVKLVQDIRAVEECMGEALITLKRPDRKEASLFRRGLYSKMDISAGTTITPEMIKSVRPEKGLTPGHLEFVIGRIAKANIPKESPITFDVI